MSKKTILELLEKVGERVEVEIKYRDTNSLFKIIKVRLEKLFYLKIDLDSVSLVSQKLWDFEKNDPYFDFMDKQELYDLLNNVGR